MRFHNPDYLMLYLLLPVMVFLFIAIGRYRRRISGRIGNPDTVEKLFGRVNKTARNISILLWLSGMAFMVAALARPQYPGGVEKIEARGGKIVIALDVSLSMLAPDFQPNRLEKAKREIIDLLDKLKAQTVGLVIFAGEAFVQCPPTIDYSAFRMFLDVAEVGMISDTGTNLADAIEESAKLLSDDSSVDKAIIIFTDGEAFEGNAKKAASEAAKMDIRVYAVGVGSTSGRPIPDALMGSSSLKKNDDGEIIISRLNVDELISIADAGRGKFYRATPGEMEIDEIYADIKGLRGEDKDRAFRTLYKEKYKWFLLPGTLLAALSFLIPPVRKNENEK